MAHRFVEVQPQSGRHVEQERVVLTQRQQDVLAALKAGKSEKEAATMLRLSPHTVHAHAKAVYQRYGVTSRGQLLSLWIAGG